MTTGMTGIVCEGDRDSPTVLVLDPAPRIEHGELPPGWSELTGRRQVVWCRLAAAEALPEVERLLADPDALGRPIDIVARSELDERVRAVLSRNAGPVRALLLVDPAPDEWHGGSGGGSGGGAVELGGVTVRTVGRATRAARPLEGDDVRHDVESAVAALDADSAPPTRDQAEGGT